MSGSTPAQPSPRAGSMTSHQPLLWSVTEADGICCEGVLRRGKVSLTQCQANMEEKDKYVYKKESVCVKRTLPLAEATCLMKGLQMSLGAERPHSAAAGAQGKVPVALARSSDVFMHKDVVSS